MFQPAWNNSGAVVIANEGTPRDDEYTCLCCGGEMILRKGQVLRPHFAHKTLANCSAESALHKAGKVLLSEFLYERGPLTIKNKCKRGCCKNEDILELNEDVTIIEEKVFWYRNKRIIPDLSIICNQTGELLVALEIYNTHRQKGRPEPWYEFRASDVVELLENPKFELHDIRKDRICSKPRKVRTGKRRKYICGECGQQAAKRRFKNCYHYSCRNCYNFKPEGHPCSYCQKPIK